MTIKKLGILLFLIGVISIFGCKSQELSEPLSRNYETMTGELKSLGGVRVNKSITNLFQNDDGKIYYAYSTRYDLDDPNYTSKRIEAYGLITTHEELDKEVFEIRSIIDAPETVEEANEIKSVEYSNDNLGFKLNYPSNWAKEEISNGVIFTAPESGTGSSGTGSIALQQDYVLVSKTSALLERTSSDELEERASEIRNYVRINYPSSVGVANEFSYLGVDKLFAVKYKTGTGEIYYFTPRGFSLYEISYYHPSAELDKVKNLNIFSEIISRFRFIPAESNVANDTGAGNAEKEDVIDEMEIEDTVIDVEDESEITVNIPVNFKEFESQPYKFKILYPSSWYYSGGNYGYDFSDKPMEEGTISLIRLDLKNSGTVGKISSGTNTIITVKVGERYYTLSASSTLADSIQIMADSIEEITE